MRILRISTDALFIQAHWNYQNLDRAKSAKTQKGLRIFFLIPTNTNISVEYAIKNGITYF